MSASDEYLDALDSFALAGDRRCAAAALQPLSHTAHSLIWNRGFCTAATDAGYPSLTALDDYHRYQHIRTAEADLHGAPSAV